MNGVPRAAMLAAVALLAGGLLAGCGGGDDAASQPTPSFSSSTASPTAGSSAPPSTSSSPGGESPQAFVRRWNDLSTAMQNTGDTAAYLAASSGCVECGSVADTVQGYYRAGGSVRGGAWHFRKLTCKTAVSKQAQCTGLVNYDQTIVVEAAGHSPQTLAHGTFTVLFYLSQTSNGWNMDKLEQQAT